MRIRNIALGGSLSLMLLLAACGGQSTGGVITEGSSAPFTLAITAPFTLGASYQSPSGITVLSLQVTVTGAVLQPGNVSLINSPVTVDLTQLQTDNGLLAAVNVPTGSYETLVLTFANPDMTIFDGQGGTSNCSTGTICEFQPTLSASSITLYPALTLTANAPAFVELELDFQDLLLTSSSLNLGALTFLDPPAVQSDVEQIPLNTVAGVVTGIGSNQFTMTMTNGESLSVIVTDSTQFAFPSKVRSASKFSCLAKGQIISTDMSVLGSGAVQANKVTFEDSSGDPAIEGVIVAIENTNPPQFSIVIHGESPDTNGIDIGNLAKVTLEAQTNYLVDSDGLTVPSAYTFGAASDLVVGQEVLVRGNSVQVTAGSNSSIAISTNQLILRQSQWTATVRLVNQAGAVFTLDSLPDLFTTLVPTSISNLYATPSSQTQFYFIGPTSLGSGVPVTVKGVVFNNRDNAVGSPSVIASVVVGAPNQQQQGD
jgi:hypothetical protein